MNQNNLLDNENEEPRYNLDFQNEPLKSYRGYLQAKKMFNLQGFFQIQENNYKLKIYTPELLTILRSTNLPVVPSNDYYPNVTEIDGTQYYHSYKDSYEEGMNYFNEKFKLTNDIIYDSLKAEKYLQKIKTNYHRKKHVGLTVKGWGSVKTLYSSLVYHGVIKSYGFYSGVVYALEGLVKEEPDFFKNFGIDGKVKQLPTKVSILKNDILQHGFLKLDKVKTLPKPNKEKLLEIIVNNDTPYIIAMFKHLGFLQYLQDNYFKTVKERNVNISNWLGTNERTIKGNINVLNPMSTENKERYTSHNYKEIVTKDYEELI